MVSWRRFESLSPYWLWWLEVHRRSEHHWKEAAWAWSAWAEGNLSGRGEARSWQNLQHDICLGKNASSLHFWLYLCCLWCLELMFQFGFVLCKQTKPPELRRERRVWPVTHFRMPCCCHHGFRRSATNHQSGENFCIFQGRDVHCHIILMCAFAKNVVRKKRKS